MLQRIYCRHLYSQRRAGPCPVQSLTGSGDSTLRLASPPPFHTVTVRLTSRDRELLLELKDHGAALAEDVRGSFPSSPALRMRLVQLVRAGYIEVVSRHEGGRIFALGPQGKQHLGIHSNWRTRPQEAVRQVAWRRCHAQLVAEGYHRIGFWHGGLVLYRKAFGPTLAVQVFAAGPSARHLRALLKRHRPALVREGAVLCVFSSQTHLLQPRLTRSSSVLLRTPPSSKAADSIERAVSISRE